MSAAIDLARLAEFLKSGQGETNIFSEEVKAALQSDNLESVLAASSQVWHQHAPPICALQHGVPHEDPSCANRGQHGLCTYGFTPGGMCNCSHWPGT